MRMIGKTRETFLGLPSWAMAHLRYLVLRTRKVNSSASGWYHCTTTMMRARARSAGWKPAPRRAGLEARPLHKTGIGAEDCLGRQCGTVRAKGLEEPGYAGIRENFLDRAG